jgi:transposase InsO family protein
MAGPTMGRVLRVSPSGSCDGRGRPASPAAERQDARVAAIEAVHAEAEGRSGSPRVHAELAARGEPRGVNTVAKLMRRHGVAAGAGRKFRCTTDSGHGRPVAEGVRNRRFAPGATDRAWAADITSVPTREGWWHLAAAEDRHSRRIVGGSMSERIDSRLAVDALEMARAGRRPAAGLVAHADRGSQYAGEHDQRALAERGAICSMSRRANCWDNAPVESFFASLKKEPTTTSYRRRRCRRGYNRGDRVLVGLARPGPLLSGVSRPRRRSCTMSDRPAPAPPRA